MAVSLLDDLPCRGRCLADVAGDRLCTVDFDDVALREHADCVVDLTDEPGDGRLSRARVSGEHEVRRRGLHLQPVLLA